MMQQGLPSCSGAQISHRGASTRGPRGVGAIRSRRGRVHSTNSRDSPHQIQGTEADSRTEQQQWERRAVLASLAMVSPAFSSRLTHAAVESPAITAPTEPDTTITNKVAFDISVAPRSFKTPNERTLGDKTILPLDDAAPVGRLVLGLYGNTAPGTVANFLRLVNSGALQQTTFSKVLPGEYIQAGQQNALRMGGVEADEAGLQPNPDMSSSQAFKLRHLRPGTLSLSLTENDEDPAIQATNGYRNVQFLITTGPGPVPRLDGQNIVFGRVLEGLDVVNTIAKVPTFKPSDNAKQMNLFAQSIGDERALRVRRKYGKPLKAVIIMKAMELPLNSQ